MGKGPEEFAGDGPRGAVLWLASREWRRGGEVAGGEISLSAVRLRIVGNVRVWIGGVGYCKLP
jgi:hypothetical protein